MFLNNNNKINITICGMMGSGKTAVGKIIAKKINFDFIDTDLAIEKESGRSINNIFNENGEQYFRKLEERITINILMKKNYVISLGGGTILSDKVRKIIKENSYNIYLKVKTDILSRRLEKSKNRPLINNINVKKKLSNLIIVRERYYNEADLTINNESNINETVYKILKYIKNNDQNN